MFKNLPFNKQKILLIQKNFPTPFYIYDEKGLKENVRELILSFSWVDFKEYFAVKAAPTPGLIKILHKEGCGADCSSLAELALAERSGIKGEDIIFSSNNTPLEEYKKALELGALINLDDITHIEFLQKNLYIPETLCLRYNPGKLRKWNPIIGKPEEAKFGFSKEQLFEGYKILKKLGVKKLGIHTMLISNELEADYFVETAEMIFNLILEIYNKLQIKIEFMNLGGGLGIPYRPEEKPIDIKYLAEKIKEKYQHIIIKNGLHPVKLFTEFGRYITGPFGYLISTVIHKKEIYKKYIGLDANMANLMRPGIYGAYHHITILGKENNPCNHVYDVIGSLCENNDKFAIDRPLPEIETGDIIVIHDTGAHGHSMGFNYNGKLRSAELLLKENGEIEMIRRAENLEDYFATVIF